MHSEAQLNDVALGCGLAMGELIQDESEKKLLITVRQDPTLQQRACVAQWARRNGLKAVFVTMKLPSALGTLVAMGVHCPSGWPRSELIKV